MMHLTRRVLWAALMAAPLLGSAQAAETKIGFVVKQPEEPWFQDEWKFADQAGKEKGFTVVKIGAEDGEKGARGHRQSRGPGRAGARDLHPPT